MRKPHPKAKAKEKNSAPLDLQCYRREQDGHRVRLSNMVIVKFPFNISVRTLDSETPTDTGAKRSGDAPEDGLSKRRNPTPQRYNTCRATQVSQGSAARHSLEEEKFQHGSCIPPTPHQNRWGYGGGRPHTRHFEVENTKMEGAELR